MFISSRVPVFELGTSDTLFFDYLIDTLTFSIANSGTASLSWTASPSAGYLNVDPGSGSVAPGTSSTVVVALDRSGLDTGSYAASIFVSTDAGQSDSIAVRVEHFDEPKWLLSQAIVDAEFSRTTNRIVAISDNPPMLLRLDPETRSMVTMPLPAFPVCVSLSPDGAYAAVGHYISVTYVDLNAMSVVRSYPVGDFTDPFDIVLAPDWVYVFPLEDQFVNVRCIELSTGTETLHTGRQIYEKTIGRLDASGDFLYVLDTNVSPPDLHKLDRSAGTASYLYDSPYHGQYPIGENFWVSQDGARLLCAGGSVFSTATAQPNDMLYVGDLVSPSGLRWIDHSTSAGRIFGLPRPPSPFVEAAEIRVYGDELLDFQGTIPLPQSLVTDGSDVGTLVNSEGHYVFCNLAGTRLYTLSRPSGADPDAPWAVWTTDVPALP